MQLFVRDPECAHDAPVERLLRTMIVHCTAEGEAQEAAAVHRIAPQVDADQSVGPEPPRGLLARFADRRFEQGFAILEMSGGLVQHQAAGDPLLDHEKATVELDDRRDGDLGIPGHALTSQRNDWRASSSGELACQISSNSSRY